LDLIFSKPVVEKIFGFMSKIAHRKILNMQEVGMTLELKAMWCAFTDGHDDKNHLEKVFNLICCRPSCQYLTFVIERSLVELLRIIET
jgi:hypothetical protein